MIMYGVGKNAQVGGALMGEPLTKAMLDLAISEMERGAGTPLPSVIMLPVNPWTYEYILADRRKARRMRRRLKRGVR